MYMEQNEVRKYWVETLCTIAKPVLEALSQNQLKEKMPVECIEGGQAARMNFTYLEAVGRTLAGLAPWLENENIQGEEEQERRIFAQLARDAIQVGTNPKSVDVLNFEVGPQPIVDAAFLAHAVVRAPNALWKELDKETQANLVKCLKITRTRKPYYNNWLLFSAMIETALWVMGEPYDPMRIDYALKQHMGWYKGDGMFGDGPEFQTDYYNSFVIQPMLVDIIKTIGAEHDDWKALEPNILVIAKRYAEIQERLISPEGTFPPIGRSLAYRFGAFQHLAQMALQKNLPEAIRPGQVRCALTAVIHRMIQMPGTFDDQGWLKIGFCGSQPGIGERYISTGSLYLCTTVFLPLGLDAKDAFWTESNQEWTSQKIWSGQNVPCDHGLKNSGLKIPVI